MIRGVPIAGVPCGVCGTRIREWVQDGPDDDDLTAEPCEHTLEQFYLAWVDRLKQRK